jgi:hypothetical protein
VPDLESLSDLTTPWCVRVVATLRIADHLAEGPRAIEELAASASCDAEALHRVLRHLVQVGVFEEPSPGVFALNGPAERLTDESVRLGLDLDGIGGRMAQAWGSLLGAVRTGRPAYADIFGRPFWEDLDAHPIVAESFDALMGPAGHGTPDPDVLVNDAEWAGVRHVVDVGGGTGTLLVEIMRCHPHVRGTLVDLARTVDRASRLFAAAGLSERTALVAQSFFDPLPAGADVYLLKNVLDDWPDDEVRRLLERCADAARPNGRVVAVGGAVADGGGGAPPNLLMLVLVGGKARTLTEFTQLAASAGLTVSGTRAQRSGRLLVECRPDV